MDNFSQQSPNFAPTYPLYPSTQQMVRVLGGTIPGPSGYASSSVLGPSIYLASTQQLSPTTLLPRDREPCLALDVNRVGLSPGYYLGRLSGSYRSLPLYEVGGSSVSPLLALSTSAGLTPTQVEQLSTLSPNQLGILSNLNTCQLQVLLNALPISQIQTLTSGVLTSTQLSNLVNESTSSQLTSLYQALTTSQIITLTNTLNQGQISYLENTITSSQIRTLITSLTTTQLIDFTKYPASTIYNLSTAITNGTLTTSQLQSILNTTPLPTNPISTGVTQTATFTSGTNNNVPLYGTRFNVPTTGSTTITGFVPLNPGSSQIVTIFNTGTSTLTLSNNSGSSSSGNRIKTSTGSNISVASGSNTTIQYNPSTTEWNDVGAGIATSQGSSSTPTEGTLAVTGSTQGDAAPITTDRVTLTGADGTKGAILPNTQGATIGVYSPDAGGAKVYPPSGARINFLAIDAPFTVTIASTVFFRISSTQWIAPAQFT